MKHLDVRTFQTSAFIQDKLSTLIGQLMKETMDKRNSSYRPLGIFYPSLTVFVVSLFRLVHVHLYQMNVILFRWVLNIYLFYDQFLQW